MTISSPPLNYFTCTLGEASERSGALRDLHTIIDFIDQQAKEFPEDFAVGFPVPENEKQGWNCEIFTFEELRNGSLTVTQQITHLVPRKVKSSEPECVGLLCPSSVDFLFAWLGLMRAGAAVLLIAPQCQPAAIAHLCKSCNVSVLFHDEIFKDLALRAVAEAEPYLHAVELPWQTRYTSVTSLVREARVAPGVQMQRAGNALDAAFIFHTSGTSTGLPKPIVQSHHAAFSVLPVLDGRYSATFTTTPLYHGGVADCLRAWTSRALIWLFPAKNVPITTQHICACLAIAAKASSELLAAHVKYFATVPYILQMLAEESSGLSILKSMEMVSVGGAALSPNIGNHLVEMGVNLVSRFGSAECGFLLSSDRAYAIDKDWQYLRHPPASRYLSFEDVNDSSGLFELVVIKGWPPLAKSNRADGSFATSDLFEPHPSIKRAWRYHSRNDSQITLSTGKKFDPAPMEDHTSSSTSLIREALVFGTSREEPGILVFPSAKSKTEENLKLEEAVWKVVQGVNSEGQAHTRISKDKLVMMSADEPPMERSSKGTLIRGAMEKKYAKDIHLAYVQDVVRNGRLENRCINGSDMKALVQNTVMEVCGPDVSLDDDADFYAHGLDSVMCSRIGTLLQKRLMHGEAQGLPWNVVYDCGNIDKLSQFLIKYRQGTPETEMNGEAEMIELVKRFSKFETNGQPHRAIERMGNAPFVVLLTGATGALGAHILNTLRDKSLVSQIICLVRAGNHSIARSRVSASLTKRKKPGLDMSESRVWCLPSQLNHAKLGHSDKDYEHIQQRVTHIIHAAWAVNFTLPLRSFVDEQITGLHRLLNFALSCSNTVQFSFCSSTASVLGPSTPSVIDEELSSNPSDSDLIGYSKSKWVAEAICAAASKTFPGDVFILRIGQLTGDTENGIWNTSEAYPLILSIVEPLGCLPQLEESLSWLPVDTCARSVVDIALKKTQKTPEAQVYHLVNYSSEPSWSDLLAWIADTRSKPFSVVSPTLWLDKLENLAQEHPAKNLLGLWRKAYGKDSQRGETCGTKTVFSVDKAQKESNAMQSLQPIDQGLAKKIWVWLENEIAIVKAY